MPEANYTPDELMTLAAARKLQGRMVCFVGIGIPSVAANLARITHAPDVVLIYESGTIGTKPDVLPLSIGDSELAETASAIVTVPEVFSFWLQGARVDVGFLGAAQIDRFANINSTVIGDYQAPTTRLPGAGGAPEIASGAKEVWIVLPQSKRSFVERVDFVTSSGLTPIAEKECGVNGYEYRPRTVITDLGVFENDKKSGELVLKHLHPGVSLDEIKAATGWRLRTEEPVGRTPMPTDEELRILRELKSRTVAAHGQPV